MLDTTDNGLILHLAACTLAKKPGKNNWVEEDAVNGLPEYICRIARAVYNGGKSGKSVSQAIAIAVGRVKTWARGGGGVNADTRAKAAKAVAEWERKKAAAKLNNKKKVNLSFTEEDLTTELTDQQLEKASLVPCTEKVNRSLLETVRLSQDLKMEEQKLMKMSAAVLDLLR